MLLTVLAFWGGVATAQESSDPNGGPLAIPGGAPPPPPAGQVRPKPRVEPGPPSDDLAHARAIREYREQHLALRKVGTARIGVDYAYVPYGGYGPYGPTWGITPMPHTWVVRGTEWAVFEGPNRIDVPTTFDALGDEAGLERVTRRIRTNRTLGNLGYAVGLGGLATSIVGLVQMDRSRSWSDELYWSQVSAAGVGLMIGGFVGGTFPAARAERLQHDHEVTFDLDALDERIDAHNEALAADLGLSQTEAARLERR
jgi:hypothetical protein